MDPTIERRWAGHALVAMGVTQSEALLAEYAARLHAVKDLPPYEQAKCPLPLLQCSVAMYDDLHERARAGNERLQELRLGDQMSNDLPVAPKGMRELLEARLHAENPPVPRWLGEPMQAANILQQFGEPDADALAAMTLGALDERLGKLERGAGQTKARAQFLQQYQPANAVDQAIESAAATTYNRLHLAAREAFDKQPAPTAWAEQPTVSRRIMDKIGLRNPTLAHDMMTREKPIQVVDGLAA